MSWLGLALACLAGAVSPGPSLLFILAVRGRDGAAAALAAAAGHGLGVGVYALAAAAGLAFVIQTHTGIGFAVSLLGAAYLLWLAYGFWPRAHAVDNGRAGAPHTAAGGFFSGFLVAVLNPKVVLFFAGVFAAMVPAGTGGTTVVLAAVLAAAIDAGWYALVAMAGARLAQRIAQPAWARGFAVFFALAALVVAARAARGLLVP